MKPWLVARELIRQNWWLWLLLLLWPWGMVVLLRVGGGPLAPDDLAALLRQEFIGGWAMAAFTAGTLLGNEERSGRIVLVMARAMSRSSYIAALWLTAGIPLAGFTASAALSGAALGAPARALLRATGAELTVGVLLISLSLLLSMFLPGILAASLSLGTGAALVAAAGAGEFGNAPRQAIAEAPAWGGLAVACALAGAVFGAACLVFARRDLKLKSQ